MIYKRCPNCGHVPSGWSVSHMNVYRCKECRTEYCHECAEYGKKCPKCGSERRDTVGEVYNPD